MQPIACEALPHLAPVNGKYSQLQCQCQQPHSHQAVLHGRANSNTQKDWRGSDCAEQGPTRVPLAPIIRQSACDLFAPTLADEVARPGCEGDTASGARWRALRLST